MATFEGPQNGGAVSVGQGAADNSLRLYISLILAALVVGAVLHFRVQGVFACAAEGYSTDRYLAYCNVGAFGDYDHGAYWLDLEPGAIEAAKNANVLLLGNSRLLMGFSSNATHDWFSSRGLKYHLLGFGGDGNQAFIGPLLDRLKPRATAYVINVDRFFVEHQSERADALMHDPMAARRHVEKRFWQGPHRWICDRMPTLCGREHALFRSRSTGDYLAVAAPNEGQAVTFDPAVPPSQLEEYSGRARSFIEKLGVAPDCVILTIVPHLETREELARQIAATLGTRLVVPRVPGLRLYDGSHLDRDSAERWSAAFFTASGEQLRDCAAAASRASRAP